MFYTKIVLAYNNKTYGYPLWLMFNGYDDPLLIYT